MPAFDLGLVDGNVWSAAHVDAIELIINALKNVTNADLIAALDARNPTLWTNYTVATGLTQNNNPVTNTTNYAAYRKSGTACRMQGKVTATGAGAIGPIQIGAAVTMKTGITGDRPIGTGIIFDASTNLYHRCLVLATSTTKFHFQVTNQNASAYAGSVGGGFVDALAAGDTVSWDAEYETV